LSQLSKANSKVVLLYTSISILIVMWLVARFAPAYSQTLDSCGTERHVDPAPHCWRRPEFCDSYSFLAFELFSISKVRLDLDDPQDILAVIGPTLNQGTIAALGQDRTFDLTAYILKYIRINPKIDNRDFTPKIMALIRNDCIGGYLDGIDGDISVAR
jgi:hypothetical protein